MFFLFGDGRHMGGVFGAVLDEESRLVPGVCCLAELRDVRRSLLAVRGGPRLRPASAMMHRSGSSRARSCLLVVMRALGTDEGGYAVSENWCAPAEKTVTRWSSTAARATFKN